MPSSTPDRRPVGRRTFLQFTGGAAAGLLSLPAIGAGPAVAGGFRPADAGTTAADGTAADAATAVDLRQDTWTAVDGLGRRLPDHAEVGDQRTDRFVGLFYFLWLGQHPERTHGPWNIGEILAAHPEAKDDKDHPAWGPLLDFHHWGEPHYGYYLSDDRYVIRQHAQMFADAGIDVIIFDATNGFTYPDVYQAVFETFAEIRAEGGTTPGIAFMCPWDPAKSTVGELYRDVYAPGLHEDLWFQWDGKPLILANPALVGPELETALANDPCQLPAGSTQGQTITVAEAISALYVPVPTWGSTTSGMTLRLRENDPSGALIAEETFTAVVDNGHLRFSLPSAVPAGTYYLEQSDPVGTVGWWSAVPSGDYAGGTAYLDGVPVDGDRELYIERAAMPTADVLDFFTFRDHRISYFEGPTGPDQWAWLEAYPQHVYENADGDAEEMTVSPAQNAVDSRGGAMSEAGARGRSYHDDTWPTDTSQTAQGLNFQEQWDRVLAEDPEFVFVTGWNEWVAQRLDSWTVAEGEVIFVDQFDWEHSRDLEPMVGGHEDAYYYQLVSNIRTFKGVRPAPAISAPTTIAIDGQFSDWDAVEPEYRDHRGDVVHRDHAGWGSAGPYTNTAGRNDIVATKLARDDDYLYFWAETADPIGPHTDPRWMMLFLDTDNDPSTGWEGFNVVVNRQVTSATQSVIESSASGWNWTAIGVADLAVNGTQIELAIPRTALLSAPGSAIRVEFKWIDNLPGDTPTMLDVLDAGDAAPSGRFRYLFEG